MKMCKRIKAIARQLCLFKVRYEWWTNLKMCKRIRAITRQLSVCLQKCGETTLRGNRSQLWPVARKTTIVLRQLSVQRPPKNVRDVVSFSLSSSLSVNINYARITKIHSTPHWERKFFCTIGANPTFFCCWYWGNQERKEKSFYEN